MPPKSKVTPRKKRRKRARVSDGGEERSGEEMVVEREESKQREESEQREDESEQREDDSGIMEEEEGETVQGREPEESADVEYSGARRAAQSGQPPFSDEDVMEMVEFVQANPVLFAKELVHYFDKVKKDRLWEEIGSRVGRSVPED